MSKHSISEPSKENEESKASLTIKKMCGIIMPIADTAGYDVGHWKDVLNILEDALKETDFEAKLVSERLDIGLIHEEIVKNIYENEIVICDVSSKNPNVMFELGMRLAFDKPTIIIKDERTNYSFDIGGILHLEYPSSLRHNKIEKFKADLCKHVLATYAKSKADANYSPFLKSFGKHILPKKIEKTEISEGQYIIEKLDLLSKRFSIFESRGIVDSSPQIQGRITRQNNLKEIIKNILTKLFSNYELENLYVDEVSKESIREMLMNSHGISISTPSLEVIISELISKG